MVEVLDFVSGKVKFICFLIKVFILVLIKNGYNQCLICSIKILKVTFWKLNINYYCFNYGLFNLGIQSFFNLFFKITQ